MLSKTVYMLTLPVNLPIDAMQDIKFFVASFADKPNIAIRRYTCMRIVAVRVGERAAGICA